MSLRLKIMLSFLVMALFMTAQAVIGFQQNDRSRDLVDQAINKNYPVVQDLNTLSGGLQQTRRYEKEFFIYILDLGKKHKYFAEWRDSLAKVETQLKGMRENADRRYTDEDIAAFKEWEAAVAFYSGEFEKIAARFAKLDREAHSANGANGHPAEEANDLIQPGKTKAAEVLNGAEAMMRAKTEAAIVNARLIEDNFVQMEWISVALTGSAILISIPMILVIYGSLVRTLSVLLKESQRIYDGNLSAAVEPVYVPEFRTLANALEQMRIERLATEQRRRSRPA
jgi:hypothetical protein